MRRATRLERTFVTNPPDFRGFFLHRSTLEEHGNHLEWQCPWCSYSLLFTPIDRQVAEMSAHGHILRQHGVKLWDDMIGTIQALRSAASARHGFGGDE